MARHQTEDLMPNTLEEQRIHHKAKIQILMVIDLVQTSPSVHCGLQVHHCVMNLFLGMMILLPLQLHSGLTLIRHLQDARPGKACHLALY